MRQKIMITGLLGVGIGLFSLERVIAEESSVEESLQTDDADISSEGKTGASEEETSTEVDEAGSEEGETADSQKNDSEESEEESEQPKNNSGKSADEVDQKGNDSPDPAEEADHKGNDSLEPEEKSDKSDKTDKEADSKTSSDSDGKTKAKPQRDTTFDARLKKIAEKFPKKDRGKILLFLQKFVDTLRAEGKPDTFIADIIDELERRDILQEMKEAFESLQKIANFKQQFSALFKKIAKKIDVENWHNIYEVSLDTGNEVYKKFIAKIVKKKKKMEIPEKVQKAYDEALKYLMNRVTGDNRDDILENLKTVIKSYQTKFLKVSSNSGYYNQGYSSSSYYGSSSNRKPKKPEKPVKEDVRYEEDYKYFNSYSAPKRLTAGEAGFENQQKLVEYNTEKEYKRLSKKYDTEMENYDEKLIEYEARLEKEEEKKEVEEEKTLNTQVSGMLDTFYTSLVTAMDKDIVPTELMIYEKLSTQGQADFIIKRVKDLFSRTIFADAKTEKTQTKKERSNKRHMDLVGSVALPFLGAFLGSHQEKKKTKKASSSQQASPPRREAPNQYGRYQQNSYPIGLMGGAKLHLIRYGDDDSFDSYDDYGSDYTSSKSSSRSSYSSSYPSNSSSSYSSTSSSSSSSPTKGKQIPLNEIVFNKDQYLRYAISEVERLRGTCGRYKSCLDGDKKKIDEMLSKTSKKNKGWKALKEVREALDQVRGEESYYIPLEKAVEAFKNNGYEGIPSSVKSKKYKIWALLSKSRKEKQKVLLAESKLIYDKIIVENLKNLKEKYKIVTKVHKDNVQKMNKGLDVLQKLTNKGDKEEGDENKGVFGLFNAIFGGGKDKNSSQGKGKDRF